MKEVSNEEIIKLAKISGIALDAGEVSELSEDLTKILEYVNQLDELDLAGVEPTYQVTNLKNIWREDDVLTSPVSSEELVGLAPEGQGSAVKVPKVL